MDLYECRYSLDYSVFSRVNIRLNEVFHLKTRYPSSEKEKYVILTVTDAWNSSE